ncbi:MAG: Gfo/Idh/MocA family protein [Anaeromyxobacteraceae bacterium]
MANGEPLGFVVVGLGHIAQTAVLPAFAHAAPHARLVGVVSGDEAKRREVARRHGVRAWSYDALDDCLADPEVDAVYIALPNSLHEACAVRAAHAGVHVLCEKPMATSSGACEAMIRAAAEADVRLMIAYRLHFEPANVSTIALLRSGELGDPRFFTSEFSFQVKAGNIRTRADLGGGALWDLGVYCVNAARYLFEDEPEEAFAMATPARDDRFQGVDEGWSCLLRFPGDRLASFAVSFGAATTSRYRLVGTEGDVQLDPAYEYQGELVRRITVGDRTRTERFGPGDQFAPELIRFAECVRTGAEPEPSGREGLADVRAIEALLESARAHRPIRIAPVTQPRRPELAQALHQPPVEEPEPVRAQAPPEGS